MMYRCIVCVNIYIYICRIYSSILSEDGRLARHVFGEKQSLSGKFLVQGASTNQP